MFYLTDHRVSSTANMEVFNASEKKYHKVFSTTNILVSTTSDKRYPLKNRSQGLQYN